MVKAAPAGPKGFDLSTRAALFVMLNPRDSEIIHFDGDVVGKRDVDVVRLIGGTKSSLV